MILKNATQNTVITKDLRIAKSTLEKSLGLFNPKSARSILITTHFGIHTFFLRHTIDILITDDNLVVKKAQTVKPNRILVYNPLYKLVIELPSGSIKKSKTRVGDSLDVIKSPNET